MEENISNDHTNESDKDSNKNVIVHVVVDYEDNKIFHEGLFPIIVSVEVT